MATILKTTDAPRFVETDLTYLPPTEEKPTVQTSASQVADSPTRTGEFAPRRVLVEAVTSELAAAAAGALDSTTDTVTPNPSDDRG